MSRLQQLAKRVCRKPSGADLAFMADLMAALEEKGVAAPGPIEQRWSASSSADMSPASSPDNMDVVHSWVGIIMYLPEEDQELRTQITQRSAISSDVLAKSVARSHRGALAGQKLKCCVCKSTKYARSSSLLAI